MIVRGDKAERHPIVGCPFQFAARKYARGAAVHQEAQQYRRVVASRTRTAPDVVAAKRDEIDLAPGNAALIVQLLK
jgi:hypothetical protein